MAEMRAHLILSGNNFDPSYVTKETGLQPDIVQEKDETHELTEWGVFGGARVGDFAGSLMEAFAAELWDKKDTLMRVGRECSAQWHLVVDINNRYNDFSPELYLHLMKMTVELALHLDADIKFNAVYSHDEADSLDLGMPEENIKITPCNREAIDTEADMEGAVFQGYSYNEPRKNLVVECDNFSLQKRLCIEFNNVLYYELIFDGNSDRASEIQLWKNASDDLLLDIEKSSRGFFGADLQDRTSYISSVITMSQKNRLSIICEDIDLKKFRHVARPTL